MRINLSCKEINETYLYLFKNDKDPGDIFSLNNIIQK
jgi:hypothetical protein